MKVLRRFATLCLAVLSAPIFAFDFDEHKYLSNLGLRIALEMAPACADTGDARSFISAAAIDDSRSFGDLVGMADYVRGVDVLFEGNGAVGLDNLKHSDLPWPRIKGLKKDLLRFLQAAHINEIHFQQAALIAHVNNHQTARSLAREGKVNRALVMEAYALHFLEDFHAAGHISATRSGMVDYVAIASHGKYNTSGLTYTFTDDAKRLLPIIDWMLRYPSSHGRTEHSDLDFSLGSGEELPRLRHLIEEGGSLEFFGDSTLHEHQLQAFYLVVLATRSILDIFEARCPATEVWEPEHSFVPICWVLARTVTNLSQCEPVPEKGVVRAAGIPYGKYDVAEHRFDRIWFRPWDVTMVSYYTQATRGDVEGASAVRSEIAVEALLVSGVAPGVQESFEGASRLKKLASMMNGSLAYGYSHTYGPGTTDSVHLRALIGFPRINLQASASYGVRWVDLGRGRSVRRYPVAYGLEAGFGFVFLHLGTSDEYFVTPITRELRRSHHIRTGITVVVPTRTGIEWVGRKIRKR